MSPGVFRPGGINVQETRSSIPSYARIGSGYGSEDHGYGARRWIRDHGEWRGTTAANALSKRRGTAATDALSKRCSTAATNALLIYARVRVSLGFSERDQGRRLRKTCLVQLQRSFGS